MAPIHVDAINSVPLEFYSHPEMIRAWRLYTSHLNNQSMLKASAQSWAEKKFELLIDLVYNMGKALGYDHIDKATLLDNLYVPQGYEDQEEQFRQIRNAMLHVLKGERPVPVTMVGPVELDSPMQAIEEFPISPLPTLAANISSSGAPPSRQPHRR